MVLAIWEKTLLALEPISWIVPTTKTRITANMTAYSAMSWPRSSDQTSEKGKDILAPTLRCTGMRRL